MRLRLTREEKIRLYTNRCARMVREYIQTKAKGENASAAYWNYENGYFYSKLNLAKLGVIISNFDHAIQLKEKQIK